MSEVDVLSALLSPLLTTSACLYRKFSRFSELISVPDKSATTIARAFFKITPDEIVSDNCSEFFHSLLQSLCNKLNIKKTNILPYIPHANGMAEVQ